MAKKEKNIGLYQSLVKNSFNEIYTFDAISYKFIYLNPSALNNLGYTMEDVIELTPLDIKPDYDINSFNKLVKPLKEKKEKKIVFYTNHKRKNGSLYPVEIHLQLNTIVSKQYFSAFILDITERKELETNLIESNNIINASPIVVFKFGNKDKWDTKFVTENVIDLLGYSASTFLNNEILYKDVIHQEDFNHVNKEILNYYKTNQQQKLVQEYRVITKKGTIKWVRDFPSIKKEKDHNNYYFTTILQDITEQKEVGNALKLSEKKFKELFNKSSDALLIIKNNIFIDCNIATCKMLGYATKNEFLNVHPSKLSPRIQPDGKNSFKKDDEMMRLAYKKGSHKFEWIHTKKNGDDFPVEVLLTTIHNEPNNKVIYCVWRDIAKRKFQEMKLLERKESLLEAQKLAKIGNYNLDLKTQIFKTSVNFNDITGVDLNSKLTFAVWRTITHPEDSPTNQKELERCIRTGEKLELEYRILTKNTQELKWIHGLGEVIYKNGEPTNFFGTIQDITERKKAELIIKESEHSLLEAQKVAKIGSYNLDLKTLVAETSTNFNDIVGVDLNYEVTFAIWRTITHPEDTPTNQKELEKSIKTGEKFDLEFRILTKRTQELKWIHGLGEVIYKNGEPTHFFGTIQDITQQKRAQFDLENAYSQVEQLKNQLEMENVSLKEEIALSFSYEDMIYSSQKISDVLTQVEQVSSTDATVLILGETGTGKELIAKAVHNTSNRKNKPLIRVNCAAIPAELIESELFGHIKGSFTGAINNRIGKFELADGGTLFLDEIGDLQLALQPKLLRAIQEGEIEPIGSSKNRKLDVRIIVATNKNLQKEVEEKRFREDLYFRLNVFPINIPPLRERIEDIPVLIDYFVSKYCTKHRKKIKYISELTMQQMKSYAWPGNVRELENLIERSVIISDKELLIIKEFETSAKKKNIKHSNNALEEVQRNHILKILNEIQWKIDGKEGAAVLLDIKPSTLRDRMKKFGIIRPKS